LVTELGGYGVFASAAASDSESAASLASIGAFFSFFVASATAISSEGGAL
jgi:hypothetical protein